MLRPLNDVVIVDLLPQATKTEGGIHLSDKAAETFSQQEAIVVAVGPGRFLEGGGGLRNVIDLKPGDVVVIGAMRAQRIMDRDGKVYRGITSDQITCRIEGPPPSELIVRVETDAESLAKLTRPL